MNNKTKGRQKRKNAIEADKAATNLYEKNVLLNTVGNETIKKRRTLDDDAFASPNISTITSEESLNYGCGRGQSAASSSCYSHFIAGDFRQLTNAVTSLSNAFMVNTNKDTNETYVDESLIEEKLNNEIDQIKLLISNSCASEDDKALINSLLHVLIHVYCTKNAKFYSKIVKEQFKELGLQVVSVHVLFMILEKTKKNIK